MHFLWYFLFFYWHMNFYYAIINLSLEEKAMLEEYPSLVEGTGLENRKVVWAAQGFESLFLRHLNLFIAGWSSLVARRAHNPEVVGSNPAPATNLWSVSLEAYDVCLSRRRSRVRIPYGPPFFWLHSSVGRAEDWKSLCRWFNSRWSHHLNITGFTSFFFEKNCN